MKNITEIASGDKYVPWEELSTAMDDNFKELDEGKLGKDELAQGTGSSTTTPMSQDAVTKELAKKLSTGSLAQGTGSSTDTAMSQDAVTKELAKKQDTLVSGVSIKTINGQSILGLGNIVLSGGTGGTVIPLKKGTETNYNTTTTTEAAGGELYYNSSTVKIYYRVGGVNYTDWNVEGFYTRADVCDPNGVPITGAFYLIDDELNIFNGTKMVLAYEGAKIHYLAGLLDITSNSTTQNLDFVLNDVVAFYNAISSRDTIFYDSHAEGLVLLSAFSTGIFDTEKTIQLSAILVNAQTNQQFVIHGEFVANITENKVTSITSWDKQILSNGGGISDAPSDDKTYGRKNGGWEEVKDKVFVANNFLATVSIANSESRSLTPEELTSIFGDNTYTGILNKLNNKSVIDVSTYIGINHLSYTYGGNEDIGSIVFLGVVKNNSIDITIEFRHNETSSTSADYVTLVEDAPSDGKKYVRQNGSWVAID